LYVVFLIAIEEFSDIVTWIGSIETHPFNCNGGLFHSHNHEVTVTIPSGAIPKGKQGVLKFAATLCAPVKFAPNVFPVSAIVSIRVDVDLQKPITLCLPHFVSVENKSHVNSLFFAKMTYVSPSCEGYMNVIDSGEFKVGKTFGLVNIDSSSYYCIANSATVAKDIPESKYRIIAKHKLPVIDHWKCDVCIIPALSTCKMVIIELYDVMLSK